jgi:DNA-directed RNA polymerase
MDIIIADAVRMGFVRTHGAMPLERFREAALKALPDGVMLDPLPKRGEFDVERVLGSGYFFC